MAHSSGLQTLTRVIDTLIRGAPAHSSVCDWGAKCVDNIDPRSKTEGKKTESLMSSAAAVVLTG